MPRAKKSTLSTKGHEPKITSKGVIDQAVCSCGWESGWYWDGVDYAIADWEKHAKKKWPKEDD